MNVSTTSWAEISIMHFHRTCRENVYYLHPESQGVAWWGGGGGGGAATTNSRV